MDKKRAIEIDILKSIAIIFIIVCHLDNYIINSRIISLFDSYLALFGLSIFFFVSGFLLQYSDFKINSKKDIYLFYAKKVLRLFPMYWISILSISLIFIVLHVDPGFTSPYDINLANFLVHMLGLQVFFPVYHIQSMWFVGVIFLYYILYPIAAYFSRNTYENIIMYFILILPFVFLKLKFGLVDINFFIYYFVFTTGVFFWNNLYKNETNNYIFSFSLILFVSTLLIITNRLKISQTDNLLAPLFLQSILSLSFSILIYLLASYFVTFVKMETTSIFFPISYGSYAIYLFQHQYLSIVNSILGIFSINRTLHDLCIVLSLPILFFLSYYFSKMVFNYK
ncbi:MULTISPECIES: acyltransferase [unclassified Methanosarcina]